MSKWVTVKGVVQKGYGVASGRSGNPRFPEGTIAMQKPVFQALGLNLDNYFVGTINVSIAPQRYKVVASKHTFRDVKWSSKDPAEDFSFFDCRISTEEHGPIDGLIYYPHPETKPEHFQSPDILEIMAPFISGLNYGDTIVIEVDAHQLRITDTAIS